MSRQTIVAPIGLIRQPNQYGQYKRGALETATNVVMRDPGVISSRPATRTFRAATAHSAANDRVIRAMISGEARTLQYAENAADTFSELSWVNAAGITAVTLPTAWIGCGAAGCSRLASTRDRYFFTCYNSVPYSLQFRAVLVFDSENDSTARTAGLSPVACLSFQTGITADAQAILADSSAAWRALMRRTASTDGYELVSAPSWAITGFSGGSTIDAVLRVHFPTHHNYVAGDVCEVYRTVSVEGDDTDPGDVMYLAVSQLVTGANITAGFMDIRDNCPDASLGAALYTNSGEEGAEAANFDPPVSTDMVPFKGHMFFAATQLPAKATIGPRTAYGLLTTNYERLYGIGLRNTTGDFANGSPNVTNVVNMRGIVPGTYIIHPSLPGGDAFVNSIGANSFTMDSNASATSVGSSFQAQDSLRVTNPDAGMAIETWVLFPWFIGSLAGTGSSPFVWITNVNQRCDIATGSAMSSVQYGVEIIMRSPRVYGQAMTLRATNGVNYSPPLPEATATANSYSPDTRHNRYAWSKFQQPEHAPSLNFGFVGGGRLLRMMPTRDALWFFCTDGMHRLSGSGGDGEDAWRLDPADPNLILAGRNALCSLKETLWAYTNRGLVAVSDDGGIQEISNGVIGDLIPGASFSDTWDIWMVADEAHQEVWLTFRSGTLGAGSSITYLFNTLTKTFVRMADGNEYSVGLYAPFLRSIVLGQVVAGSPMGNPNQLYFHDDTSTTRMTGVDVRYQPLFATDPFLMKQFQSVTMMFNGVSAAATLTPNFSGTDYTTLSVNQSTGESRVTVGVPRNAPAIAGSLRPGFKMSNVAAAWSFRGLSARFSPGGEETERD